MIPVVLQLPLSHILQREHKVCKKEQPVCAVHAAQAVCADIDMPAVQIAAAHNLMENTRKIVEGRAKLGIEAFAQALLGIPKILAENSGYDAQETLIKLQVRPKSC